MDAELEQIKADVIKALGPAKIAELQDDVDQLKKTPQFRQYVEQRKLQLIDSRMKTIDNLLLIGVLK